MNFIRSFYTEEQLKALYNAHGDRVLAECNGSKCQMFRTNEGLGFVTERIDGEDIIRDMGHMTWDTMTALVGAALAWNEIDLKRLSEISSTEEHEKTTDQGNTPGQEAEEEVD